MGNFSLSQTEALRAAGLQVLFSLRQEAMQATLHDLQEDLAEARSTSPSPALEAAPWSRAGLQSVVLPSVTDENLFKAHLAARTAMHMAGRVRLPSIGASGVCALLQGRRCSTGGHQC